MLVGITTIRRASRAVYDQEDPTMHELNSPKEVTGNPGFADLTALGSVEATGVGHADQAEITAPGGSTEPGDIFGERPEGIEEALQPDSGEIAGMTATEARDRLAELLQGEPGWLAPI